MSESGIDAGRGFVRDVMVAGRRWRARMDERLKGHGMTEAKFAALVWLARSPDGLSQSDVAELAGIEPAALVRTVDGLEAAGCVERRACPTDRRKNILHLTDHGRSMTAALDKLAIELGREVLGGLHPADLVIAARVLSHIRLRLDAVAGSPAQS
ncbi:MarR family transcriptional regulator [Phenylobacterium sp.]|uniref:MarR family winged helix-turn-helix transcriptional regulator n=1 Tax=Phenylobacterium sp. TaxID=1871053 RepID=UPI0025CCED81|nr:MarR family transcriptional regulator [Phenylobacterium sp.]